MQMDGLETRMDHLDIRFGGIEKSLFAKKTEQNCCSHGVISDF